MSSLLELETLLRGFAKLASRQASEFREKELAEQLGAVRERQKLLLEHQSALHQAQSGLVKEVGRKKLVM